jgi:hypothetical protein
MHDEEIDRDWPDEVEVGRSDTGFRILDSIFFAIVFSLVETLLAAIVIFQLGYSLVTEQVPSRRIRDLGNRLCTYAYQVYRSLTHNTSVRPFPFSDFPEALEPSEWPYADSRRSDDAPQGDYVQPR